MISFSFYHHLFFVAVVLLGGYNVANGAFCSSSIAFGSSFSSSIHHHLLQEPPRQEQQQQRAQACFRPIQHNTHTSSSSRCHGRRYASTTIWLFQLPPSSSLSSVVQRLELTEQFERWTFLQDLLDGEVEAKDVNELLFRVLQSYMAFPREVVEQSEYAGADGGGGAIGTDVSPPLTVETKSILESLLYVDSVTDTETGASMLMALQQKYKNDDNNNKNAFYGKNKNKNNAEDDELSFNYEFDFDNDDDEYDDDDDDDDLYCQPGSVAVLKQLERLLPDPVEDADAHKGTWDTIVELHGREMVKVLQKENSNVWWARNVVARVLIYYDFLTDGVLEDPFSYWSGVL